MAFFFSASGSAGRCGGVGSPRQLLALFGRLGKFLGLFLLFPFQPEGFEFMAHPRLVGAALLAFAFPDFALGKAEVIDQGNMAGTDVSATAAFDAVEQVVTLGACRNPWRGCTSTSRTVADRAGQARAQAPQRMQGSSIGLAGNRAGFLTIRQFTALVTGAARSIRSKPIIGPPTISPSAPARRRPLPQADHSAGYRCGPRNCPDVATWPVMVTTRENTGSPSSTARYRL
jgi:hypothetical protein